MPETTTALEIAIRHSLLQIGKFQAAFIMPPQTVGIESSYIAKKQPAAVRSGYWEVDR